MRLAVITCHFNPQGYGQSRRNFLRFLRQMRSRGVPLFVAELAFGEANFVTNFAPDVLQVRTDSDQVLWYKENLLNLVEQIVPSIFDAMAWIDADVWFERPDWFEATETALEQYPVVQMGDSIVRTCFDGTNGTIQQTAAVVGGLGQGEHHPGMAWAARRSLWTRGGGLYEHAIIGGGDAAVAGAWFPRADDFKWLRYRDLPDGVKRLRDWKERRGQCGCVSGRIWHEWHGADEHRQYGERIVLQSLLDIHRDLRKRTDGLLQWTMEAAPELRREVREYFQSRKEDGDCGP
ncbi:MAG TPA: hypothetical protein VNW72_12410 [Chthoniobacterales bacterium]|jgi:hypothetical protein|nr:hypothetical protein [Chthoniobacterales bacterium]